MDVVLLSRLQFAAATYFHFLFVPLTLGLSLLVAIMETIYVKTGNETYKSMTRFWGKLFLINFVVGVVTGITLEFQFGTNWSRYSRYVGDIFGPLLAIEATVSFFLESTFIAVWAFGWDRLSPRLHCVSIWLVAVASSLSAVWILIANAWMQHPVGYVMQNGRPVLADLFAVATQSFAILTILHVLAAAYVVAGFFVMGISAYHLLKKTIPTCFRNLSVWASAWPFRSASSWFLKAICTAQTLLIANRPSWPPWRLIGLVRSERPFICSLFPINRKRATASRLGPCRECSVCLPFTEPTRASRA